MNFREKINYNYSLAGVTERLIAVNVGVFLLFILLGVLAFLFQTGSFVDFIKSWLILPRDPVVLLTRPWTIITYAFMHEGFWHILSNMIILYFSSRFFLTFYSPKRLLNYYFLGAIVGGIFFLLSYNLFPVFQNDRTYTLAGASAAVMAILIGAATHSPNMGIRIFMFTIKLWWIAAFFVLRDLVSIPVGNAGGHIAHLGGAALGFIYSTQLDKGRDIGAWFENTMDFIVSLFQPSSRKNAPFKKVYRNKAKPQGRRGPFQSTGGNTANQEAVDKQKIIDEILDKISKSGYESLSKKEKDFLFNAGKDKD